MFQMPIIKTTPRKTAGVRKTLLGLAHDPEQALVPEAEAGEGPPEKRKRKAAPITASPSPSSSSTSTATAYDSDGKSHLYISHYY